MTAVISAIGKAWERISSRFRRHKQGIGVSSEVSWVPEKAHKRHLRTPLEASGQYIGCLWAPEQLQVMTPWTVPEHVQVPWEDAIKYVDLVQYNRNKVLDFLGEIDNFSLELRDKKLNIIDPYEHTDDINAGKILREVLGNCKQGKCLMIEKPRSTKIPEYRIDHHYDNETKSRYELNSVKYKIPASSSVISMLVCEKVIENFPWKYKRINETWPELANLALTGSRGDYIEPSCGMAALISAQAIESGIGKLVDWPIFGWDCPAEYGIDEIIDKLVEKDKLGVKESVRKRFGDLIKMPARNIEADARARIVDYLKQEIEPQTRSWAAESAYLEKKNLLINDKLVLESELYKPYEIRGGMVDYLAEVFNQGERKAKLINPKCVIIQDGNFNRISFMGRITCDRVFLNNRRFNVLIHKKDIPRWFLPLVITQPAIYENGTEVSIYSTAHSLYKGLDNFHMGRILGSIADEVGGIGGGLEIIGGMRVPLGKEGDALSLLGEKFKEKIPKELTYGKFPTKMLENARKFIYNSKFDKAYA